MEVAKVISDQLYDMGRLFLVHLPHRTLTCKESLETVRGARYHDDDER
jgi:hypothetical protein